MHETTWHFEPEKREVHGERAAPELHEHFVPESEWKIYARIVLVRCDGRIRTTSLRLHADTSSEHISMTPRTPDRNGHDSGQIPWMLLVLPSNFPCAKTSSAVRLAARPRSLHLPRRNERSPLNALRDVAEVPRALEFVVGQLHFKMDF